MSYFIKWTLIQYEIHTRNMFVCSKLWPFFFVLTRVVRIYSCVPWLWLARPTDWLLFVWSCIFGFWNGAKRSEPTMKCMLCFQKSIRSLSLDRRKSSVSSISTSIPFISFHLLRCPKYAQSLFVLLPQHLPLFFCYAQRHRTLPINLTAIRVLSRIGACIRILLISW